jgi:pyridoxine 5-phosphate synthase
MNTQRNWAKLGVNIDHIATLRQLRGTPYPDLLDAAQRVEHAGADQITVHLREDRRHIQDQDVKVLRAQLNVPLNLEMAVNEAMIRHAIKTRPDWACLVPEKRNEVTTEGGLELKRSMKTIARCISRLKRARIKVSLFIEPTLESLRLSHELGADAVELHTGRYCLITQVPPRKRSSTKIKRELKRLTDSGALAHQLGLGCHAGHGLDYENVRPLTSLKTEGGQMLFEEYNIGHSIVCRAAIVGIEQAVREMISAIAAP